MGTGRRRATREYVWGTGYADEILCQVDRGGADPPAAPRVADLYYYLQDANYNVVAVLDSSANLLLQHTYDPYGNLAAIDVDPDGVLGGGDPPHNAIAHQGLFFERFFGSAADLLADAALAPADALTGAGPAGLYHNRNRWYSPDLGRFISRDPNESALPIVVALARNGDSWSALLTPFDARSHYADGLNLYLYIGGNPINGLDALGLWNDPFDEVDQIIYALTGGRAAAAHHALHTIGAMAQQAAIAAVKATVAAMFPPYALYLSIECTATALENMAAHGVTWENSAVLGMGLVGVRMGWGPAMGRMQSDMLKLVRGFRSGYRAVTGQVECGQCWAG